MSSPSSPVPVNRWAVFPPVTVLLIAMIGTFVLTRASLSFRPNADFNIAGFNIHHLYTGAIIVTICCVPLAVARLEGRMRQGLVAGLGIGLALVLDEVVYLITTDGSNASYLTPISWIGGITLIVITSAYALFVAHGPRGVSAKTGQD
jgi:hypothetical protein